ncbi:MAG: type II toxin-antitoxin system RelE/ParE family toxin [Nitrospinae bacterium]|nr:type II toxin-antitoxin system RelE/ParE family toxin [Nitrospinota bacterium]
MKIRKVLALKEVAMDLYEGRLFYEHKEPGIGDYFFDSLISDLESLKLYAGIHVKQFSLRRMLSKRFPFAIYYETDVDTARVIAVLDMRRNPSWIREALGKRNSNESTHLE